MNHGPSREQSRLIVLMLSEPNRLRLMFGQPLFPGPDVEQYEAAMKQYNQDGADKPKQQPTNE